ncbi:MAG: hypothetical protein ACLPQS_17405 [Acidimicrobiales bacterium]
MDRRTALKLIGSSGVAVGLASYGARVRAGRRAIRQAIETGARLVPRTGGSGLTPSLTVEVYRRDDLFDLSFDLYNLQLTTGGGSPELTRINSRKPAYIVVNFPMQHLGEEASQSPPAPPYLATAVGAYAAGPSQLVFGLPKATSSIPFTLKGLLSWMTLSPELTTPAAIVESGLGGPGQLDTFIEAPWQLFLSPNKKGLWNHSVTPVSHNGLTELWQTRLGTAAGEYPFGDPEIAGIWAADWPDLGPADPFPMPLQNTDRRDIVTLSSGGTNSQTGAPVPAIPIPIHVFMLTPLGAGMDLDGRWNEPSVSSLIEWRERMTAGRDSYVRIVRAGFIYPFGHKAVWITITDRQFQVSPDGDLVAYLVQQQFVEITEPSKTYPGTSPEPFEGRQNPFRTIKVKTSTTPPLDPPSFISTNESEGAFWPMASGSPVPFSFQGLDFEGRTADFTTNVIWVDEEVAFDYTTSVPNIEADYTAPANVAYRSPALNGQLVAFAPPVKTEPGATAHHADALEFDAIVISDAGTYEPAWFPVVANATVRLPAAEQVTGGELPGSPPIFDYASQYLTNGFQHGVPEVFFVLDAASSPAPLTFPADKSGGAVTPNFNIDGVSREHGPTSDSHNLLAKKFDPTNYFAGLEAKILGGLDLFSIIEAIVGSGVSKRLPKIKTHLIFAHNDTSLAPTGLQTTVDWNPSVSEDPTGTFDPKGSKTKTLEIHVKIFTPFADPSNTTFQILGKLVNFDVNLFGADDKGGLTFLNLHFDKLLFSAKTGAKVQFTVDITAVNFEGPLTFINDLEQYLASLGGPSIDIQPTGLTVSYSLPIPDITCGVLAIENISLFGQLTLPFDGTPVRLEVDFCTRDNPFILTIDCFGGGGFLGVALGTDGIELIEVSLEFGAAIAMDLGVASGSASIMAGIYFSLAPNTHPTGAHPPADVVTLTGFLQANGDLEVLGIISISILFYLGFTYQDPGKCTGTATVTVTVKVLIFSASVSLTVTKTFGGSGDPSFAQAISQADFDTYCAAFAA